MFMYIHSIHMIFDSYGRAPHAAQNMPGVQVPPL